MAECRRRLTLEQNPTKCFGFMLFAVLFACVVSPIAQAEDWPSWGGPRGDFTVEAGDLAEAWPEGGPPRLWQRPLGRGYSAIIAKDDKLFTMYGDDEDDVVIALDAATGKTLWEQRDTPALWPDMSHHFGLGPNSTPLLIGDRIIAIGMSGRIRAVDAAEGKLLWLRDLPQDFGRRKRVEEYGYSGSPLEYQGKILVQVGGRDAAIVALHPDDGSVVWESAQGGVSYSAPILRRLADRDHYVYFEPEGIVGLDPATGETLWKHGIEFNNGNHLTPAVPCGPDHLWVSSQFDSGGGRLLQVFAVAKTVYVREHWFSTKLSASHWPLHCRGDLVYGSIGGNSSSRLAGVRWRTGEIVWQERGFHKAQALRVDDQLLFLDEDGVLALARVSPEGITILSKATVAAGPAWTIPTLIERTVYIRDQEKILALDLATRTEE